MKTVSPDVVARILAFVDSVVPGGGESVWLAGSRSRGEERPDSDWDVIAFTSDATVDRTKLFESNQIGPELNGGPIELVIVNPCFKNDAGQYMTGWRNHGVQLR
jgi:hypothetical protein